MSVVYDTILSAIHNVGVQGGTDPRVVYDTILSAIHNFRGTFDTLVEVVYDTILSAIHNGKNSDASDITLYMIRFCQLFTTILPVSYLKSE